MSCLTNGALNVTGCALRLEEVLRTEPSGLRESLIPRAMASGLRQSLIPRGLASGRRQSLIPRAMQPDDADGPKHLEECVIMGPGGKWCT